jgi:hypothetical protein
MQVKNSFQSGVAGGREPVIDPTENFTSAGSPISRQVKRRRRSCENFSYSLFQPSRVGSLIDAPLFSSSECRIVGPHQSPIRFKALGAVLCGQRSPAPGNFHCPRKLSVPRRVQGYRITDPLALPVREPTLVWLTAWAYHRITAPPSCRYVKGRDSGQIGPCGSKPNPNTKLNCPIPAG